MANSNTPFGLRPVGTLGSAGYVGRIEKFHASSNDSSAIGLGDVVYLTGTADANGVPTVARFTSAATGQTVGVLVGVVPTPTDLTLNYRKASTEMYCLVDTDPNTIYEVQDSDTTTTTALAATDVGANCSLVMGTVNTTTGNGKTVLNATTAATTTTLAVQILRLKPAVDNAIGSYAKWIVKLANHQYGARAAGV